VEIEEQKVSLDLVSCIYVCGFVMLVREVGLVIVVSKTGFNKL